MDYKTEQIQAEKSEECNSMKASSKRVVITATGACTPLGVGADETLRNLWKGECCFEDITEIDLSNYAFKRGGQIKGVDSIDGDRGLAFIDAAVAEVVQKSSLHSTSDIVLCLGSNFGSPNLVEQTGTGDLKYDKALVHLSKKYDCNAARTGLSLSCSTGAATIGWAYDYIRRGYATKAIAGGYDGLSHFAWSGLSLLRTMTSDTLRPFDANRSGTLFSEGAAVLMLEELESAQQRGAPILAEIVGWGTSNNTNHMTAPSPDGAGLKRSMEMALKRAGVTGAEVGLINTHGTGTTYNDLTETRAIKEVCKSPFICANKASLGHMMGAAGAIEALVSIQSLVDSSIPATLNHLEDDPELDLPLIVDAAQEYNGNYVLSNSSGIGGTNVSLLFRRFSK